MRVKKKTACLHWNNVVLTCCPPRGSGLWRWCLRWLPAAGPGGFPTPLDEWSRSSEPATVQDR